jgi:hypothetical protein
VKHLPDRPDLSPPWNHELSAMTNAGPRDLMDFRPAGDKIICVVENWACGKRQAQQLIVEGFRLLPGGR